MTTKVTVDANGGRPVKVIPVNSANGDWLPDVVTVPPHETREFWVNRTQDLIIHEVQPDEKTS